jgi:hypothetical protein
MAWATHAPRIWGIELSLRLATIPAPSSNRNKLSPIKSRHFHAIAVLLVPICKARKAKGFPVCGTINRAFNDGVDGDILYVYAGGLIAGRSLTKACQFFGSLGTARSMNELR